MSQITEPSHPPERRFKPFFDTPIQQIPVSPQLRRRDLRLRDGLAFVAPLDLARSEAMAVINMLELVECTHGAQAVVPYTALILLTLMTSFQVLGRTTQQLAIQRGYATFALFVGALFESEFERASGSGLNPRRAPSSGLAPRAGSPNLEFEDLLIGARVVRQVLPLVQSTSRGAIRRVWGAGSAHALLRTAGIPAPETTLYDTARQSSGVWLTFVGQINQLFEANGLNAPGPWRACYTQVPR